LDEQPLIFVSIEIVEMDLLQVEFDLLIQNNNSVLRSSFDTKQRTMKKEEREREKKGFTGYRPGRLGK
jgi:hypothetical protein